MHRPHYPSWRKKRFFFLFFMIAGGLVLTYVVMLLWNALLPELFKVPPIRYSQALGLFVLCRLLFGRFHFGGPGRPPFAKSEWRERWMNMSEEERMQFKSRWKERCNRKE